MSPTWGFVPSPSCPCYHKSLWYEEKTIMIQRLLIKVNIPIYIHHENVLNKWQWPTFSTLCFWVGWIIDNCKILILRALISEFVLHLWYHDLTTCYKNSEIQPSPQLNCSLLIAEFNSWKPSLKGVQIHAKLYELHVSDHCIMS